MEYTLFKQDLASTISILLLLFTIVSVWFIKSALTIFLFASYFCVGLMSSRISWYLAFVFVTILVSLHIFFNQKSKPSTKIIGFLLFFTVPILLLLDVVPGINNWEIISKHPFGTDSIPYSIYLNFASPLIGLSGLIVFRKKLARTLEDWIKIFKVCLPIFLILLSILMPLSYLLGYVRFDLKFTNIFYAWALSNLFFTCITEEVFFRLFLQNSFIKALSKYPKLQAPIGIGLASLLFGVAHFAGGIKYVFLASIAGVFYGYSYYKSKKIEASILTHFLLNATHFVFFSYPALQSAIPS